MTGEESAGARLPCPSKLRQKSSRRTGGLGFCRNRVSGRAR